MSFTASVENDTIKLPPGVHLPDGTEVSIEPRQKPRALEAAAKAYHALLAAHRNQAAWLASWEGAPLAEAPRPQRRRA
jgi:hypothetical protein